MKQVGGKVIGSGSYGCVFKPKLTCNKNKTKKNTGKNIVSKLMTLKHSKDELKVNIKIYKKLKKIPNINDVMLFTSTLCKVKPLKMADFKQMNQNCSEKINSLYDSNIDNLRILQIRYGGINLDSYVSNLSKQKSVNIITELNNITNNLIKVMKQGIIKMHEKDVYHTDVKGLNLLYDGKNIRLIDWGLALVNLPKRNFYSGIHFNRPYESLLFNFPDKMDESKYQIIIDTIINEYQSDILRTIIDDIKLFIEMTESEVTVNEFLSEYLMNIATLCTTDHKFDIDYFRKLFYKKQDYWGLFIIYLDIYIYLNISSEQRKHITELWKYLLFNIDIDTNVLHLLLQNIKIENKTI